MNIEEEVKSLKEAVETLSAGVVLIATTILDAADEIAKEEEQERHEVQVMREFSDDEAKLIADILWEYLNSESTYNNADGRATRLTGRGSLNVHEVLDKIYTLYVRPEYTDHDKVNFDYMEWPE